MVILVILSSGVLGTTLMTLFSHILELLTHHKFNEAHLLNELISRSKSISFNVGQNHYYGWIIHYAIGVCMAAGLFCYYFYMADRIGIWVGSLLGFVLGIIGIVGWSLIINFHSNPPCTKWKYFFAQLIVAHIIFGLTATWVLIKFLF
ncbi:hypothetical protein [uncultured Maribacter sp.]|uniref:hypothetical protein n=1 Tax=uncultured Maribacter sp. TaxID=431308 RepID=UPI0030ED0604|tara:strand:+ start:36803 stop:37246 length:444 start_codon:yes stop_codon:yes gene_type:complete